MLALPWRPPEDDSDGVERWEFGTREWCEFAAGLGVRLLAEAAADGRLALEGLEWGFSEQYLHEPERLRRGWGDATATPGYHLLISRGEISGGVGVPAECLATPGFHIAVPWAMIAHASLHCFNVAGAEERGAAQAQLWADLAAAGFHLPGAEGNLNPRSGAFWPEALRPDGPGSSPLGAVDVTLPAWPPRLLRSPELEGLPETPWGVPIYSNVSDTLALCCCCATLF